MDVMVLVVEVLVEEEVVEVLVVELLVEDEVVEVLVLEEEVVVLHFGSKKMDMEYGSSPN